MINNKRKINSLFGILAIFSISMIFIYSNMNFPSLATQFGISEYAADKIIDIA